MSSKPIENKPKNPVAFPPANYLRALRVRDGDNWWTLQKQFNLRNPWTLIRFNFATEDPAEVNWYLREYLGCVKTTADGKNYCFSGAAKPGLLYLPRRNFKNGIGGGGGAASPASPDQQAKNDIAAEKTVLWALGLTNTLSSINFDINGFQMTSHDFGRVRRLIREKQIFVAHDGSLGDNARYDAGTDTLYYGRTGNPDTHSAAMVIHEATHAAFDATAQDINDAVSESIAYIAQMLFIMVREPRASAPMYGGKLETAIFAPAWRYALRIRDKKLGKDLETERAAAKDLLELHKALIAHPTYQDQFLKSDTNYGGLAGYDGVRGWSYYWVE